MRTPEICVVGAGGAIGSRLVQELLNQGVSVTAVVRRLETATRIGRSSVKIEVADLNAISEEALLRIVGGHSTVIDCSYSAATDVEENKSQSEKLARTLLNVCNQLAIPNLIHFGTISVYPMGRKFVDEQVECHFQGQAYADGKLIAERSFLAESSKTNILILQLPIVIGPFMGWTRSIVQQLQGTILAMPDPIGGRCNALHVDDVVHATQLAISYLNDKDPGSVSERVLLSGTDRSWLEFYQAHSERMQNSEVRTIPRAEYLARLESSLIANRPWNRLKKAFSEDGDFRQLVLAQWGVRSVYRLVKNRRGQEGLDEIKSRLAAASQIHDKSSDSTILSPVHFKTFDSMPRINGEKATKLLSFSAKTSFNQSVNSSVEWAKWAGLLS